ncbi:MAG TPA: rod shape-determining protein MreC [Gemmatimonadales bacterium]|jgi:rod shape-determining protein MreC|nr:rod shape-determining protein MreC [Gemmatimonadales bacterium]
MPPGTVRSLTRRDTVLFSLCVALSVVLLFTPEAGRSVAAAARSTVLKPLLWLQAWAEASRTSRARFDKLRAERDSAAYAAQFVPSLRAENLRLRSLLGLSRRLPVAYVPAEVLHQSLPTDGRTLLVSAGSARGVRPFDPVVGPEGLLGVVRAVEQDWSVIMTWAHPEFRASAYAEPGSVFGVVAPALQVEGADHLLQLRGVAVRDTIAPGTRVVTSGLGGVYPPGLPIGTVIGPAAEETGWERVYLVRPASSPELATHVLILRAPGPRDLAPAFVPEPSPPPADSVP